MLEPSFYPDHPDRVELRETHASWVFLAGELAYKLKKPVTLPFLDYGSLKRRRLMCAEEVRLNRRLAPDHYLGVDSVVRRDGRLALSGEDDPEAVDYVVRMRRIAEERTAERLVRRGELRADDVDAVARRLAAFHAGAAPAPPEFRDLSPMIRALTQNVEALRAGGPPALPEPRVRAAAHFTRAFLAQRRPQLERRAAEGRIRECHGDLRAEHVVVEDGIVIYDCVEFDPSLRYIDVAADLAFLVMDLTRLGASDLAQRLVTSYRHAGGASTEPELLAFYSAYRAWVRAKVACVRADELPAGKTERADHEAEARALLDLGHRFAWRARLPLVLVVCGVAASGKTRLAERLAEISGLRHLSSDVTRKGLAGVRATARAPAALYTEEFNRRTYAELGRLAAEGLHRGGGVIVDATFRRRADREAFAAGLGGEAPPHHFVRCEAPADVLLGRARARKAAGTGASDAGPAVVREHLADREPLDEVAAEERMTVRTDRPVEEIVVGLEAGLDERL